MPTATRKAATPPPTESAKPTVTKAAPDRRTITAFAQAHQAK